jgi:hypothetical protein
VFSLFISSFCFGQSSKSAYSKYEKEKYEDAEEGFRKILNEYPADIMANFGMAQLCSNNSILLIPTIKDRYDFFQAFRYIRKSKKGIDKALDGEIMELNQMIKSIPDVKDKINKTYGIIEEKLYTQVMTRKNLDSVEIFINEFPDSKYYKNVLQIRYNVYFEQVKKAGDVKSFNNFIERCPDADSLEAAIHLRDLAAFDTLMANKQRSLASVYNYLNRYPLSKKYNIVIGLRDNLESEKAQKEGTFEAYSHFLENFPKSTKAQALKEKYIELSYNDVIKQNNLESFNEFLDRFPLAKNYSKQIRSYRDSIYFLNYSGSVDSLNLYITCFPASRFFKAAISARDMKAFEQAKQENQIASYEHFIYRYPAALEINEAMAFRDSLVLEQVKYLNSEMEFSKLLSDYPYLINQPRTRAMLDEVLYREAKSLDDKEFLQDFLDRCPNSPHIKEIQDLLNAKK